MIGIVMTNTCVIYIFYVLIFCTHDLVHKTRANSADCGHWSYFLGELYTNVPYQNNKTVDYYLIIYTLITIYIYIARLFVNARVFMSTRRKCAAATVYINYWSSTWSLINTKMFAWTILLCKAKRQYLRICKVSKSLLLVCTTK